MLPSNLSFVLRMNLPHLGGSSHVFEHSVENILKDGLGFFLEDRMMIHLRSLITVKKCMPIASFLKLPSYETARNRLSDL